MEIFLDSVDLSEIEELKEVIDGITTNPSLIAKSGRKDEYEGLISEICSVIKGPVSVEVVADNHEEMIKEGLKLAKIARIMETDIVVIGAGPVGIFTAFQAGMLDMRCHIMDILNQAGGQCAALYPEKSIYDIPGYPVITAQRLIEQLMEQALPFGPVYHLSQMVEKISSNENQSFTVVTSIGTEVKCKAVIIAAGNGIFEPNRPPLSGILEYENKSVFYSVNKISDFQDKTIVIAGGGDSAADWTIELSRVAKRIYVIHRRKEFRCTPETKIN
ncbi:unnamed protein product [Ceratitis capitata]|uniref:(Mediterranean fruit fly) hypothetical protein n=1 Tax=Ceratitis capitata TaxID=7213 RepID=A0A811UCB7_CERCA|nr:unnamed protein product [Ceratitis capitata]